MTMTLTERFPLRAYVISSIIASIGAFLIHSHFNDGVDWNVYFVWLPAVWLGVLVLAFIFSMITKPSKKNNS